MIKQTYKIKVPISEVWQALIDPKVIEQWSGDKAVMSAALDTDFDLWSGQVWGSNTEVVPEKLLKQDWYGGEWEKPSKVVISLSFEAGVTIVELIHTDVPPLEEADFAKGWQEYYFGPMKELLET